MGPGAPALPPACRTGGASTPAPSQTERRPRQRLRPPLREVAPQATAKGSPVGDTARDARTGAPPSREVTS